VLQAQAPPAKTFPLSAFPLPKNVRLDFESRGCSVAQSLLSDEPHNVLHGALAASGQDDWMIECWNGKELRPEVFWGGPNKCDNPMSPDMRVMMLINDSSIAIVPELRIAPPRPGEDHARIAERWSATGSWSYRCTRNGWEKTAGDSCSIVSRTETARREPIRRAGSRRRDARKPEEVASAELASVVAAMEPAIPINVGQAAVRCIPATSVRQVCYFQISEGARLVATVRVERHQEEGWAAIDAEVTRCEPK
jgi:hypothetical protein